MVERFRRFLNKPGLGPTLVKATMGSAGLRLAGMIFAFFVGVQLARGLGVEGYGTYGLAMSIIALLSVVTEFGLPDLLTREVAAAQVRNEWGKVRGILSWSNRTVVLMTFFALAVASIWLNLSGHGLSSPLALTLLPGLLLVPLVAGGKIRSAALRGLQFIVRSQLPEALLRPAICSVLLFVVPWMLPLEPPLAMAIGVAAAAVSFVSATLMLRSALPPAARSTPPEFAPQEWRSAALPMALTEGMRVLQGHLAVLLLGWLASTTSVGLFRVVSSVAVLTSFPITLFALVGAPVIARLHAQKDHVRLQRLLSWLSLGMMVFTLLMALPFLVAGGPLLGWVFGNGFSAANPILLVLLLNTAFIAIFGVNAVLLNMTGHQQRVTRASWISLAVVLPLSPLFIQLMDGLGAAIATTISMLSWNIIMWRDSMRLLSLDASFLPLLNARKQWK